MANQIQYTKTGYVYLINTNTGTESAVGPAYTNLYNVTPSNPVTLTIGNQSSVPAFDPIMVTNATASMVNTQMLVQWQIPLSSSPQLGCLIEVFNNPGYTGSPAVTFFDNDPEARQKLLNIAGVATPYARLTISDVFFNTNTPVLITPTNVTPVAATSVPGATGGLSYQYYESTSGNWTALPNFGSLTPALQGAVGFPDTSVRRQRVNYGFEYTGYITAPADGLYAFTLHSGDGSVLTIDGTTVINFDGLHDSSQFMSGGMALAEGRHAFDLRFFKGAANAVNTAAYTDGLGLAWQGPGMSTADVPASAFSRVPAGGEPGIALASPANNAALPNSNPNLIASVTTNGVTVNSVRFYLTDYYSYYLRPSQGADYLIGQDSGAPYALNSMLWTAPTNLVRARLVYNGNNTIDSAPISMVTTNTSFGPWCWTPLEMHNYPSGASIQGSTYSMVGDGMNLLSRAVSGDCTMIARLASITPNVAGPDGVYPDSTWRAGIILRSTTNSTVGQPLGDGGSSGTRFAALFGSVGGGSYFENDTMRDGNGDANAWSGNLGAYNWFKLVRSNLTNFTSFVSSDGVNWTQASSITLTNYTSPTVYAGVFLHSIQSFNSNIHHASLDNVSISGNILGPPGVTVSPQSSTAYAGENLTVTATPSGNAPFYYQWQLNSANIAGATNATLKLTNLQAAASGAYGVVLTNADGAASATATIAVLSAPASVAAIFSNNPVACWRLNETAGPTAYDAMGNYNGTGEGGIVFDVPGVTDAPFTGFEAGNLSAQFNGTDSDVAIPAMNLNTNAVTITGWIKRNGTQASWAGIFFCRSGTTTSGLNFGTANELRYTWNNVGGTYNWNSGLVPPDGLWTFFALAISPTQAVMYMATNATLQAATNPVANAAQAFAGTTYLGYDSASSARRISGSLDEIVVYNHTLTASQVGQLLSASTAATPPAVNLVTPASGTGFATPATISLNASVVTNGHSIGGVQFYSGSTLLGQVTTPPYNWTWSNVPTGTYTLFAVVMYDSGGTVSSAPAFITVNPIPSAPSSISPKAVAGNLISVSWPANTYASGYILYRNGTAIAYLVGTNDLDLGLLANTTYAYSVVATNVYGNSPASVTNSATTPGTGTARWWDAGGSTTGPQDGNGNWGTSANTWWDGAANTTWSDNNLAIFGNGATAGCSVLLTNKVTPSGLLFNANNGGNYNLSSSGGSLLILSGAPTITCNDGATISATLNGGGFAKTGPGILTITGGNTNTGAITVNGGKLVATGGGWFANRSIGSGSLTVSNGGIAEFTVAHGFGYGNGGMSATLNNGTLQFDHENYVSGLTMTAGSVSGAGEFRTTSATYSTLAAAAPSVLGLNVAFYSSATFNVARGSGAVDLLASGPANNTGAFTKSGTGIMAVSGNWANSGATTVSAGTLQVDGSTGTNTITVGGNATLAGTGLVNGATTVQNGGTLAPGDAAIGTLAFARSLTLNAGSKTVLELAKTNVLLTNDLVTVAGVLTLGGALTVTNVGPNALALGDSFNLFNAGGISGSFSAKTLPALASNLVWDATQLAAGGAIIVVSIPVITNQPSSVAVDPGSPAGFVVGAAGSGTLAYQWQQNGINLPGATTNMFTVASASTGDAGGYTVVITNNYGAVTSAVAVLAVKVAPTIGGVSLSGGNVFSLTAEGTVGETGVLLAATNLVPPVMWQRVQTNIAGTNGIFNFSDAPALDFPRRFYRVVAP